MREEDDKLIFVACPTRLIRCMISIHHMIIDFIFLIFVTARGGNSELETIQDRYMICLKTFIEHTNSQQVQRFQNLLNRLPEVRQS